MQFRWLQLLLACSPAQVLVQRTVCVHVAMAISWPSLLAGEVSPEACRTERLTQDTLLISCKDACGYNPLRAQDDPRSTSLQSFFLVPAPVFMG